MAKINYPTITVNKASSLKRPNSGNSVPARISALFPNSISEALQGSIATSDGKSFANYKEYCLSLLLRGIENGNEQTGPVDRDFGSNTTDASKMPPDLTQVKVGAGGLPATPYLPNPVSPSVPGSLDPSTITSVPDASFGSKTTLLSKEPVNSENKNPINSSKNMSINDTGTYDPGQSPATAAAPKK